MQLLTNSTANYGITEHILIETDSILRALLINSHFSRYVCGSGGKDIRVVKSGLCD